VERREVWAEGLEVPEGDVSLGAEGLVVVPLEAVPESVPDSGTLVDGDWGVPDDGALVAEATVVEESVAGTVDEGASPSFASRPLQVASTVPARVPATVVAAVGSAAVVPSLPQSA
jgi:hypothetical protein